MAVAPTTSSWRELVRELEVPVILTGGLREAAAYPRGLRRHRRGGGDARAREPREPVALPRAARGRRAATRASTRSSPSSTGSIERAVEHLGARAREPLPAQVLPVVRRAARARAPRCREPAGDAAGRGRSEARARAIRRRLHAAGARRIGRKTPRDRGRARYTPALEKRRYTGAQGCHEAPRRSRGAFARDPALATATEQRGPYQRGPHAQGRHPHARRTGEAQGRTGAALDGAPSRGRRADQGGARIRGHQRELRVQRRQERAGDARDADRATRRKAAHGDP